MNKEPNEDAGKSPDEKASDDDSTHNCGYCKVSDKIEKAVSFCKDCKELLCDGCDKQHKLTKATKNHSLVDIEEMKEEEPTHQCGLCNQMNKVEIAVSFCKDCKEPLCGECDKQHRIIRALKTHALVNIDEMEEDDKTFHHCGQCTKMNKVENAISFCKNCKEPLCKECEGQHRVIKATRNHVLKDIDEIHQDDMKHHQCGQCKEVNVLTNAVSYCKDCNEPLCDGCDKQHRIIKALKNHILVNIDEIEEDKKNNHQCGQCKEIDLVNAAVSFCKDCKEPLCDGCGQQHRIMKATKGHVLIGIDEFEKDDINIQQCGQCKEVNVVTNAVSFCKDCKEPLCRGCEKQHRIVKATKNHVLEDIDKMEEDYKSYHQCGQCKEIDVVNTAVSFCKDCKDTLCGECEKQHRIMKATKGHKLVGIDESEQEDSTNQICGQCKEFDKVVKASSFCKDCEEPLCDGCDNQHRKLKATRGHVVVDIEGIEEVEKVYHCGQCKEFDVVKKAISYCKNCKEPLCDGCDEQHRKWKATKSHLLVGINEIEQGEEKGHFCSQCEAIGKNEKAVSFCNDCQETLCGECDKQHKRMKATKGHDLLNIEEIEKNESEQQQQQLCDACKALDRPVTAKSYCKECEESLCKECTLRHKRQKSTKNHDLEDVEEASKMSKPFQLCRPCKDGGLNRIAVSFCSECDDALCVTCIDEHKKVKATRIHRLENLQDRMETDKELQTKSTSMTKKSTLKSTKEMREDGIKTEDKKKPSTPNVKDIHTDEITILWASPNDKSTLAHYQVRYRTVDSKWKFQETENTVSECTIKRLRADTEYEFQVRGIFGEEEGPYSPVSQKVRTKKSLAHKMVDFSALIKPGFPNIYQLFTTEDEDARNETYKTRKVYLGKYVDDGGFRTHEKTIMLVGATGTGKSTLVDGLVNYVLGVSFNDPFRFTLVCLEKEEKAHKGNQALSQTDWITVYTILPDDGSKLAYKLNIIDTPGFGDTRGIERDNKIVEQIRELFSADGKKGVLFIDAVCFMTKSPDARLTATQRYVFNSIAALFGKDVDKNICTLITFADGKQPPVLSALAESKLPYGEWFPFNNSALQADNDGEGMSVLSPIFWEMGCKSFEKFFDQLNKFETKSLQMTKDVLQERHNLQSIIQNLKPQVDAGLSKVHEIRTELQILEQHKTEIESNKNFQYEVEETKQIQKELKKGQHVTNCLHCHITCHDDCIFADDSDKARCSAMDQEGKCRVCSSKCHWTMHKNVPYIFEYVTTKVKKTYKEKLQKYEEASGKRLNHENVVKKMADELDYVMLVIQQMMNNVNMCNNRLREIALRPDPLTMKDHIDLMIEAEKQEKRIGFEGRIKMLQNMRQNANIELDVDELSKEMELARCQIETSTGRKHVPKGKGWLSSLKNFFS